MFCNKRFLAIIPARGGSKRLPKKNILKLGDKPLISWTIDAAQRSKYTDKVVVSTDDREIISVAARQGAQTIIRPPHLATDASCTIDVVEHALSKYEHYDYVVLLQPTSPLRTCDHIDQAIEFLMEKSANSVVSVCKTEHNPMWSNILPKDRNMDAFIREEIKNIRSQDLPQYFRLNGAIYICEKSHLLKERSFILSHSCFAFEMDTKCSVDIDTELDFNFAEFLLS